MRVLGPRTTLSAFRWDLVYLRAQLVSDERPGVAALAAPIDAAILSTGNERTALELAEDGAVTTSAYVHKRDRTRDALLVELGGVARATDKDAYASLFPRLNPTQTAKLGVDAESAEVKRILGELSVLPGGHPVRSAYEKEFFVSQQSLADAKNNAGDAVVSLALARSHMERFKLDLDALRLATHGQLLTLLKDKAEADAFFRPVSTPPGDDATTTPATASAPAGPQHAPPPVA